MAVPKVILFYVFTPVPDPDAIRVWQLSLAGSLGLRGRVIVSSHGINATLGGDLDALKRYVRGLREYAPFRGADVKWSAGRALDDGVTTDVGRLRACRDRIESEVGRFAGAVRPDVETTREFVELLDSGAYDDLKDRPVVTYCTGGIRCEVLTPLMRSRGFQRVYQLDGGIHRYGEAYGDTGLWEGSMYVFDGRTTVEFSPDAKVVGRCDTCGTPSRDVVDCADPACVRQMVRCPACTAGSAVCGR